MSGLRGHHVGKGHETIKGHIGYGKKILENAKEKGIYMLREHDLTKMPEAQTLSSQDHKQWEGRDQPFLNNLWHKVDTY